MEFDRIRYRVSNRIRAIPFGGVISDLVDSLPALTEEVEESEPVDDSMAHHFPSVPNSPLIPPPSQRPTTARTLAPPVRSAQTSTTVRPSTSYGTSGPINKPSWSGQVKPDSPGQARPDRPDGQQYNYNSYTKQETTPPTLTWTLPTTNPPVGVSSGSQFYRSTQNAPSSENVEAIPFQTSPSTPFQVRPELMMEARTLVAEETTIRPQNMPQELNSENAHVLSFGATESSLNNS